MAVILTNMDMPINCERCFACEYTSNLYSCVLLKHAVGDEIVLGQRAKDCPLKSTDEMIAEIESQVFTDAYDGQFVGIDDVKQVINKYCKENTDEMP